MNRRLIAFLTSLAALAAVGVTLIITDHPAKNVTAQTTPAPSADAVSTSTNAFVVRTIDGDTFVARLDGSSEDVRIRMLGIDTPETVDPRTSVQCFGKEASKRAAELLEGKRVWLEADPKADEQDRYGRLLRNAYLADGTDVNATLVLEGYAHAYLTFPLDRDRKHLLSDLENEARAQRRGLWNPETCPS